MVNLDHALAVARRAADEAERVVAKYYRRNVAVETKADESPVTRADRECEQAILAVLRAEFPEHAIYGEEFGKVETGSDYLWLVDPIDGTKSFVRDQPFFSTQIALMHRGELVLGVSSAKQFGEVAWARRGGGAFIETAARGVEPMRVSSCAWLDRAMFSFGNVKTLARGDGWQRLAELVLRANRTRGYGDFCHYHLLARGSIDLVLETDVNILDIAALAVIVREAGGVFTDFDGNALSLEITSVLTGPAAVHAAALNHFRPTH